MSIFDKRSPSWFTPWRATRFYVPLLIQAFSQCLTYPLVAAIVSHGKVGVVGLAAFAQGQAVMFMIGALGGGLITTGMIFSKDRQGYGQFLKLNILLCSTLILIQILLCFPPFDTILFEGILGLTPPISRIARDSTLYCSVLQTVFYLRNVPLAILYNAKKSGTANNATLARMFLTAAFSPLFIKLGWVGPEWGVVAMTVPAGLEMALCIWLSRKYIRKLPPGPLQEASLKTQFSFCMPLSIGGFMLATASFLIAAFIARADEPARMLPLHYVTLGIGNPLGFSALKMQALPLAFPPRYKGDNVLFWYGLGSGIILATLTIPFQFPSVAEWYFGKVQNVPPVDIPLVMHAVMVVALLPILQSVRGHIEGIAAWYRKPKTILFAQAVNLTSLVITLTLCLRLSAPGYLMGVIALLVASFSTYLSVKIGLKLADMHHNLTPPPYIPEEEED